MKRTNRPAFYDNLVDTTHTQASKQSYTDDILPLLNASFSTTLGQTKFCTIELEKLEQYLQYIKAEMEKQKVRVKGVKFSFGKYVHDENDLRSNELYQDRLTIFVGPIDLLSLAEGNLEGLTEPTESVAMGQIAKLNYMNITPPYGFEIRTPRIH